MASGRPIYTIYKSLPVDVPESFLAPLEDPTRIQVAPIDFKNTALPEYKGLYAVVLDNIMTQEECDRLIHYAEMSAGGHKEDTPIKNNGWLPAKVNAGNNHEVLATDYRNSDRIIWDHKEVTRKLWARVLQGKGMKEYLLRLDPVKTKAVVCGVPSNHRGQWVATDQGINERMRFLKYGAGQFFKEHCDSAYMTPDGHEITHFTIHFYLNDSAQVLGIPEPKAGDTDPSLVDIPGKPALLVRGGATTFHSGDMKKRLDVDPKAGRVLIFQHRRLLHSGDMVTAGIKYTIRSDILYRFEDGHPIYKTYT